MDVADVAKALNIDPQTVRSTHHKAMLKLRAHFAVEGR
jgi:RNA polymerase sigma-70 factor (ECF subfamily)